MIGVKIQGRLGNQMFQYAFGHAFSLKTNEGVCFDFNKQPNLIKKYFKISFRKQKIASLKLYLVNIAGRHAFLKKIVVPNKKCMAEDLYNNYKEYKKCFFDGYFQSVSYFFPFQEEVAQKFEIRKKYRKKFLKKYGEIFSSEKVIAVHVRKTDYLYHGNDHLGGDDISLPISYYKNIFDRITSKDDFLIIFVGDDLTDFKQEFDGKENVIFEENDQIIDFQILMNADVMILSNSTFAWWAAFLNRKENKQVFAPKYWLGHLTKVEYPDRVFSCLDWKVIDVGDS
jgi:hypothetical protein